MKKSEIILLTTTLFVTLFYGESVGINLGILGISYSLLLLFSAAEKFRTKTFLILFVLSVSSSIAFAWYGDFTSFLAILFSLCLLAFKSKNRDLKSILTLPLFVLNFVTFFGRFFNFKDWLPKRNIAGSGQKFISVILIPVIFSSIFFAIYTMGSSHFSSIFSDYEFDLNFWEFLSLACLGFFIAFTFLNFKTYDFFLGWNHHLKNDFVNEDHVKESTYSFLDVDAERKSGVVSFLALNILLLIFIITFNYEQFVEIAKTPIELSAETHERVNAVILSIIMAIAVIMFYFKGNFNFDEKAKSLKVLAKIWIVLNAVLVISAFAKNTEYILNMGLTYKRLGVYSFLILAIIGLIVTYFKIKNRKTNGFLFNQMIWYFYGTLLVCSFINWGKIATSYNLKGGFGNYDYLSTLKFNDQLLKEKFPEKYEIDYLEEIVSGTFLSRTLYEESLKNK